MTNSPALFQEAYEMYAHSLPGLLERWDQLTDLMRDFYVEALDTLLAERLEVLKIPGMAEKLQPYDQVFRDLSGDIERVTGISCFPKEAANGV